MLSIKRKEKSEKRKEKFKKKGIDYKSIPFLKFDFEFYNMLFKASSYTFLGETPTCLATISPL